MHKRLTYNWDELVQLFLELREQPTWPVLNGDPLLIVYDVLTTLRMSEREIFDLLGIRGYLRVARCRQVSVPILDKALNALMEGNDDEEGTGK